MDLCLGALDDQKCVGIRVAPRGREERFGGMQGRPDRRSESAW